MPSALTITVYGGAAGADPATGEIGGNKILIETGDWTFFLDFGTRFGLTGYFFDEFLQPRAAMGLRDFLRLGLIPPIEGIYRDDLCAHEPDLWERYREHPAYLRVEHLDGILLSHAHQDHNGCMGFLKPAVTPNWPRHSERGNIPVRGGGYGHGSAGVRWAAAVFAGVQA